MTTSKGWQTHKLDKLGFVGRGRSRHRPRNDSSLYGGSYPFFQTGDIKSANLYLTKYEQNYNEKGLSQSKLWDPGTLCITIAANIAETAILGIKGCFPDSIVGFIADPNKADTRFIKYYIDTVKLKMVNASKGTTQDNLSLDKLLTFDFVVPDKVVQSQIATVISSYDILIENNTRRIKILEEMAQLIYREWFVNFRFPGHEKVHIVDSPLGKIPEGWIATTLGEHLLGLESGRRPKGGITDVEDGVPSVGAENIKGIGCHDFDGEKFIPRVFFEEMRKGLVRNGDVALYKDGAYIGRSSYFRDNFPHSEFCVNEHVFLLRSNGERLTQNALYLWLQETDTVSAIRGTNANAAQPGINQPSVHGLKLILPTTIVAKLFDNIVDPMLGEIINLAKRNNLLQKTRNLLLPKLISGELDVSELDIEIPSEAK